jgi:hypothetical protein
MLEVLGANQAQDAVAPIRNRRAPRVPKELLQHLRAADGRGDNVMLTPYQPPPWRLQNYRTVPWEECRAYQSRVLSRFVKEQVYPYSAYYRRVFDDVGLNPDDINGVDDLAKIPLTSKHELLKTPENPDRPEEFVLTPPRLAALNAMDPEKRNAMFVEMTQAERHDIEQFLWEYHPTHANHTTGRSTSATPVYFTRRDCYDYAECCGRESINPFGVTMVLNPFTAVAHQAFWLFAIGHLAKGGRVIHTGGGKVAGTDGILEMRSQSPGGEGQHGERRCSRHGR